jgi:hypothetical protein
MNLNGTYNQPIMEEIQGAPHPSTHAKVEVRVVTDWMWTDDAKPVPKSREMTTRCQIAEEVILDEYDGEVSVRPIVRHQFFDQKQKRWNMDIACSLLSADNYITVRTQDRIIPGLKDRFGTAIAKYEDIVAKRDGNLPIVVLADKVYPQVLNACKACEVTTTKDLALADKATMARIENYLNTHGGKTFASGLKRFQDIAKAKLSGLGVEIEEGKGKKAA